MKKHIVSILIIASVLLLTLASCSPNNGSTSVRTVRVIGSAKAVQTRAVEEKFVIDSVDKVVVNGTNITDKLVPVGNVTDGQNNVEFQAQVEVFEKTTIEASAKEGFVFDEWEVLDLDDDDSIAAKPDFLDKIDDWLDESGQEHSEKLVNVPAEYIPYLVAEYDRGFYIDLDKETTEAENGSKENPYSVTGFINKMGQYDEDELTLVLSGSNNFHDLEDWLNEMSEIDELKLKAEGITLNALPTLTLSEITLSNFTFPDISIDNTEMEYKFEDCTFGNLTINGGEIEIQDGNAKNVTILNGEVEIEGMKIEEKLDLSSLASDEVEIEDVTCGEYIPPTDTQIKPEIEDLVKTTK